MLRLHASPRVQHLCFIFVGLTCAIPALADMNTSGLQVNTYVGTTITNVNPHTVNIVGETDALQPNADNYAALTTGLGVAYRFVMPAVSLQKPYLLHDFSIGLDYFSPISLTQYGETWQYQVPSYDNYNYRLSIRSQRLMLDSEWTLHAFQEHCYPFIETGIGVAQNTASYTDSPNTSDYAPGLTLDQHTQNQFAYTLGAGVKWAITDSFNASLRYIYTDLGEAATAGTGSMSVASPLNIELSTQALLFGLSYAF